MSEYERLCYAQTARTEKTSHLFCATPKIFCIWIESCNFFGNNVSQKTVHETPCTELSGERIA